MSKESPSVVPQISKNTSALSSTFKGNVSGKVKKHWYFVTIWWIIISLYWNRLEWNLWESWGYAHWPVPGASTVLGMLCEFNSCLMRGGREEWKRMMEGERQSKCWSYHFWSIGYVQQVSTGSSHPCWWLSCTSQAEGTLWARECFSSTHGQFRSTRELKSRRTLNEWERQGWG